MVALILGFLALRNLLAKDRPTLFLILITVCGFQSLIVSLTQHYGVSWLVMIQPITASVILPVVWLTFQSASLRPIDIRKDGHHLSAPIFTTFCLFFAPLTLDAVLAIIFLGYGGAILFWLHKNESLPLARLESGHLSARIWKAMDVLLMLSALSDIFIASAIRFGRIEWWPLIINVFTSFSLLDIGLLSLSRDAEGTTKVDRDEIETNQSLLSRGIYHPNPAFGHPDGYG